MMKSACRALGCCAVALWMAPILAGGVRLTDVAGEVGRVLDGFHDAAARADLAAYTACMDPRIVFLGTDATERWAGDEFREFARPYFERGTGWTYLPRQRRVDECAPGVAMFDELLDNEKLGLCRGSGVLVRGEDGAWRIVQYNLSIPIPNDLAREVAGLIAGREAGED